jgi:hypothetical protein
MMPAPWESLSANLVLLCVASLFVAETVSMSEELVLTILTALCVAIL